jgi:cupredoxin-like protein
VTANPLAMRSKKRLFSPFFVLSLMALLCAGGGLPAKGASVSTVVLVSRSQYLPGEIKNHVPAVAIKGGTLLFRNLDPFAFGPHTLTSDKLACPTCGPLFDSGDVGYQKSKTVKIGKLKAGTYGFHCNHHNMYGTLRVVGT